VRTGITSLADALVSASVVLTAAIICAGAASADPSQQDQFVALLEQDQVPLIDNLPALVARAHQICGELNGGASVYTVVNEEMNGMFEENPAYHLESARVHRTAVRFIAVSAEVYCPSHLTDPYVSDDVGFSILGPVSGVRHQTETGFVVGQENPRDTCSTCIVAEHMLDMQFNAAHLCGDCMTDEVQSANQ
jgi:hypothetical protein